MRMKRILPIIGVATVITVITVSSVSAASGKGGIQKVNNVCEFHENCPGNYEECYRLQNQQTIEESDYDTYQNQTPVQPASEETLQAESEEVVVPATVEASAPEAQPVSDTSQPQEMNMQPTPEAQPTVEVQPVSDSGQPVEENADQAQPTEEVASIHEELQDAPIVAEPQPTPEPAAPADNSPYCTQQHEHNGNCVVQNSDGTTSYSHHSSCSGQNCNGECWNTSSKKTSSTSASSGSSSSGRHHSESHRSGGHHGGGHHR